MNNDNDVPNGTQTYSAVYIDDGKVCRMWIEAESERKAREFCQRCGAGLQGLAEPPRSESPLPEAYDEKTARRVLGGISRTTLYAELATGLLERVPGTRRVLITRRSIERRCRPS